MISRRQFILGMATTYAAAACRSAPKSQSQKSIIEVADPEMDELVPNGARLEVLAEGFGWSEGPTWDRRRDALYFTDVPGNKAYRWRKGQGVDVFLDPSGSANTDGFREPGANGLWYNRNGDLIACNHGLRTLQRINLQSREREDLVSKFNGKRFNSPNDLVEARDGTLYFTDPPYGLEGMNDSPLKEMTANGVYRRRRNGDLVRLLSDMTFPNGVALSPDEKHLFVSQSDPKAPYIRRLEFGQSGEVLSDDVFFDAADLLAEGLPGLPDGMAVSQTGHLFATGPGGVLVLAPDGRLLGRILTGRATANCAFGEDGKTLFITAHDRLLRLQTNAKGVQWS